MAANIILTGVEIAQIVEPWIVALIQKITHHPRPVAAAKAAIAAVEGTSIIDDTDTSSPTLPDGKRNPYLDE